MTAILPWHIIEIKYFIKEILINNLSVLFLSRHDYHKMIHLLFCIWRHLSFQNGQTEYTISPILLPETPFAPGQHLLYKDCMEVG